MQSSHVRCIGGLKLQPIEEDNQLIFFPTLFQSICLQLLNLPLFEPTASNWYFLHGLWISNRSSKYYYLNQI
jgi:hypothetical protein